MVSCQLNLCRRYLRHSAIIVYWTMRTSFEISRFILVLTVNIFFQNRLAENPREKTERGGNLVPPFIARVLGTYVCEVPALHLVAKAFLRKVSFYFIPCCSPAAGNFLWYRLVDYRVIIFKKTHRKTTRHRLTNHSKCVDFISHVPSAHLVSRTHVRCWWIQVPTSRSLLI